MVVAAPKKCEGDLCQSASSVSGTCFRSASGSFSSARLFLLLVDSESSFGWGLSAGRNFRPSKLSTEVSLVGSFRQPGHRTSISTTRRGQIFMLDAVSLNHYSLFSFLGWTSFSHPIFWLEEGMKAALERSQSQSHRMLYGR